MKTVADSPVLAKPAGDGFIMSKYNTGGQSKTFAGFSGPSYTQVPDALFDELLPVLSGAELKVLLYVIRRTFGFKREADTISLAQMVNGIVKRDGTRLDYGAGVSKKSLLVALRSLEERQILFIERRRSAERGDEASLYRLNVVDEATRGVKTSPGGGAKLHQGGGAGSSPGGEARNSPTQETVEQETERQETDFEISNIRKVQPEEEAGQRASSPRASSRAGQSANGDSSQPEAIGAVLERRGKSPHPNTARDEVLDEDYQRIQDYIEDRAREFNDTAPLKSSTTRAWRLYQRSGLSVEEFVSRIYQARSLTQEGTARITKQAEDPEYRVKRKTKMAYFFAVLEDLLGLSNRPREAQQKSKPAPQPTSGRRHDSEGKYGAYIET
ncbi:MAG: hypothetical protein DCC49_09220 [Acidobacteria bacterium]|nr:MAG: hypothetical protein DCC49_09220 [Acidobacteriota bacterium]